MSVASRAICSRCAEPLVNSNQPCGFCRGERIESAVKALVAATQFSDNFSLGARVDAIDTLRSLGFTRDQVVLTRARALDGHSAEEILEGLHGDRALEEAAA